MLCVDCCALFVIRRVLFAVDVCCVLLVVGCLRFFSVLFLRCLLFLLFVVGLL